MSHCYIIEQSQNDPSRNFGLNTRKQPEFTLKKAIIKRFKNNRNQAQILINEFELNGFGIADFLTVTKSHPTLEIFNKEVIEENAFSIKAYEVKIRDWKKAYQQAYRYSYYSDTSTVILPKENITPALNNLELFIESSIGLWSFDIKSLRFRKYFTPEKSKPRNSDQKLKALRAIRNNIQFGKVIK